MSNLFEKFLIFGLTGAVALLNRAHQDKKIKEEVAKSVAEANETKETEE